MRQELPQLLACRRPPKEPLTLLVPVLRRRRQQRQRQQWRYTLSNPQARPHCDGWWRPSRQRWRLCRTAPRKRRHRLSLPRDQAVTLTPGLDGKVELEEKQAAAAEASAVAEEASAAADERIDRAMAKSSQRRSRDEIDPAVLSLFQEEGGGPWLLV